MGWNVKGQPGHNRGKKKWQFDEKLAAFNAGRPVNCRVHGPHTDWTLRPSYSNGNRSRTLRCDRCGSDAVKRAAASEERRFRVLLMWIKNRAGQHNLACDLDVDHLEGLWVSQGGQCAISGIKFSSRTECSADRIDSSVGYLKGNVQLVAKVVNQMKWDLAQGRFIELCCLVADKAGSQ